MLQKSGRLVLWEAMFILELHSAETQGVIAYNLKKYQRKNKILVLFFRKKMGSRNPVDSQNHRKEEKTFLQENGVNLMIRVHDTGIGMAITDQLVQLMGGETVVESLKDKGSDFTVFLQLPLAEEGSIEEKTTTENREQNADNAFLGRRILLGGGLFRRYWMASGGCDTGVLL